MAESGYCFFDVRKSKISSRAEIEGKFIHNLRLKEVANSSNDRGVNRVLIGADNLKDVFELSFSEAKARYDRGEYKTYLRQMDEDLKKAEESCGRKVRRDAVGMMEAVASFSRSASGDLDEEAWEKANIEWLKNRFGEENIFLAVVHRDETTTHIHAMIRPIDRERGRFSFNAKKWTNGKGDMIRMQSDYANAMEPLGLKRGEEHSRAKHNDLQDYYRILNKKLAALPARETYSSQEEYEKALRSSLRDHSLKVYALENAIERIEAVDATRESNMQHYRRLASSEIDRCNERIMVLEQKLDEEKKKSEIIDDIRAGLSDFLAEDPAAAELFRSQLNAVQKRGRKKREMEEERKENRDDIPD